MASFDVIFLGGGPAGYVGAIRAAQLGLNVAVIEREGLGVAAGSAAQIPSAISHLLSNPAAWKAASDRCRAFMAREYGEDRVLAPYLDTFEKVMRMGTAKAEMIVSSQARHV